MNNKIEVKVVKEKGVMARNILSVTIFVNLLTSIVTNQHGSPRQSPR